MLRRSRTRTADRRPQDRARSAQSAVRRLQSDGHAVFFTIDAGPQLKAICLPGEAAAVRSTLEACAGVIRTMESGLGAGAILLDSK